MVGNFDIAYGSLTLQATINYGPPATWRSQVEVFEARGEFVSTKLTHRPWSTGIKAFRSEQRNLSSQSPISRSPTPNTLTSNGQIHHDRSHRRRCFSRRPPTPCGRRWCLQHWGHPVLQQLRGRECSDLPVSALVRTKY